MQTYDQLFIDGAWVPSTGSDTIEVINSSTEEVMGSIPAGTPEDVGRAVAAARAAFEPWAATDPEIRGKYLQQLSTGLNERTDEIARTIAGEVGMPLKLAGPIQAALPVAISASFVQVLAEFPFEEQIGNSLVVREPVGVVGCITPWNFPLHRSSARSHRRWPRAVPSC